ncbi:MAG TPA: TetR/AcrR family transcriptional regulator [Nocardioidaceae bacterium]|nr:TetR/AcrR family transcriptional regulator [Nocardioidaceae bacterium]
MTSTDARENAAPRTRRRGRALDDAISAAVLQIVIEQGAAGVTMEAVAARAGTSKPVLYRRWRDRAALLRDTLVPLAMAVIPHTDTGSYRGDMLAVLRGWADFFASPEGVIGPTIVGAMPHDPELAEAFRRGVIGWRKEAMQQIISRGIARGQVRPDVRVDVARELGQALLWHRFLVTGDEITDDFISHVVDSILLPYAGLPPSPSQEEARSDPAGSPPGRPAH